MKIIQINSVANTGSTGRIAENIGVVLLENGHESIIAFGRAQRPGKSVLYKIGNQKDVLLHGIKSLLFDRHGFGSVGATKSLIAFIEKEKPDAIGIHNLHGYYINIEVLFNYLHKRRIPVLWTLFDCWSFTGHCSYFDDINCDRWKNHCFDCPKIKNYPASLFLDNSKLNFNDKKRIFTSVENIRIVVHSHWLKSLVEKSFLSRLPVSMLFSGIDTDVFYPRVDLSAIRKKYNLGNFKIVLGVANIWNQRKGLADFIRLYELISAESKEEIKVVLVGLSPRQISSLPVGMLGIERTESVDELADLYSVSSVFVNPTLQDNFPTTNLEALACGTPVITYNTGGSPESIDEKTGIVVEKGNVRALVDAVECIIGRDKKEYSDFCRQRALSLFDKRDRYLDYILLFEELIKHRK